MRSTVKQQAGLPAAAPSQSMSWLPHCMSTLLWRISVSIMPAGSAGRGRYVADDVQPVDGQALYQLGEGAAITPSAAPVEMTSSSIAPW